MKSEDVKRRVRPRGLLIEDEHALATALARQLEERGWDASCADTIDAALAEIGRSFAPHRPFAAVVTDLMLPDGDGRLIVRVVKNAMPRVPVVAITGSRWTHGA